MKKIALSVVVVSSLILSIGAAQAGGLAQGTAAAVDFKAWLFTFLGVVAAIYLMFKGMQAWAEKIQWFDFIMSVVKVSAVGGTTALTTWAWGIFA